jgi:hypothetical protein
MTATVFAVLILFILSTTPIHRVLERRTGV